ncbi:hypothetical protein CVS40_11886 [Lucilia cuprina]|nr:hypothetical protein CVS40_11886 [Lucilia cuprina]
MAQPSGNNFERRGSGQYRNTSCDQRGSGQYRRVGSNQHEQKFSCTTLGSQLPIDILTIKTLNLDVY